MKRFDRRRFLATTGTAVAGIPWLASLADQPAYAQGPPLRFVLVTVGHSIMPIGNVRAWLPSSPGALTALPDLLSPLEPFRDRLTIVSEIDNLVTELVSSNGHNASSRTLQTCMPHAEALDGSGGLRSGAPELDYQSESGGPSIEYVIADQLGGSPLTLRVGERNLEHRRTFRLDRTDDEGESDPSQAFTQLFGAGGGPTPALTPEERLLRRRNDVMSTVQQNYRALSSRVGAEDRARLESHANLIRDFQAQLTQVVQVTCDDPQLPLPSGFPGDVEEGEGRSDDLIATTQNSLIATALSCQATRVVSLHYSNMQVNQFPFLNGGADMFGDPNWHGVTHHDGGTDEERVRVNRWYFDLLADLLTKLEAVPEGDGTLLDHTVVLFTSSLAASSHATNNLPVIFAGGSASPLVRGQYVDVGSRTLGDLWTSTLRIMGIDASSFGWNQGDHNGRPFNSGPIDALFA